MILSGVILSQSAYLINNSVGGGSSICTPHYFDSAEIFLCSPYPTSRGLTEINKIKVLGVISSTGLVFGVAWS